MCHGDCTFCHLKTDMWNTYERRAASLHKTSVQAAAGRFKGPRIRTTGRKKKKKDSSPQLILSSENKYDLLSVRIILGFTCGNWGWSVQKGQVVRGWGHHFSRCKQTDTHTQTHFFRKWLWDDFKIKYQIYKQFNSITLFSSDLFLETHTHIHTHF